MCCSIWDNLLRLSPHRVWSQIKHRAISTLTMRFEEPVTSSPNPSNDGHFTSTSHSPFHTIVVISKIESLYYLPGYDGLSKMHFYVIWL